jgi:hypothetical protein
MNNTKLTLAMFAVLMAATLVVGTFATVAATQPAFAAAQKKPGHDDKKDNKARDSGSGSRNGNTITALKCQNKGSASGFDTTVDQECENLICTHPGNNATCVQEGAASQAQVNKTQPVTLTCEQCLTKFLSADQIRMITLGTNDLAFLCERISGASAEELHIVLVRIGVSETVAAQLIQCLIDAGVVTVQ